MWERIWVPFQVKVITAELQGDCNLQSFLWMSWIRYCKCYLRSGRSATAKLIKSDATTLRNFYFGMVDSVDTADGGELVVQEPLVKLPIDFESSFRHSVSGRRKIVTVVGVLL